MLPLAELLDWRRADTAEARRYRDIENHYHVELIAKSEQEVAQYLHELGRNQQRAAVEQLRATAELAAGQARANESLGAIERGVGQLSDRVEELCGYSLDMIDAINEQTDVIRQGLARVAKLQVEQLGALRRIAAALENPQWAQAAELQRAGIKSLERGAQTTGVDRQKYWEHAIGCFEEVVAGRIGQTDHVSWFQLGFLRWKQRGLLPGAEEAFAEAARLSEAERDGWYPRSLLHLAHVRYLRGAMEEAYATARRAVAADHGHDALYELARYAARTGRGGEAIGLLDQCIDLRPQTLLAMFAEGDFR